MNLGGEGMEIVADVSNDAHRSIFIGNEERTQNYLFVDL